jgi:hypothetical protein
MYFAATWLGGDVHAVSRSEVSTKLIIYHVSLSLIIIVWSALRVMRRITITSTLMSWTTFGRCKPMTRFGSGPTNANIISTLFDAITAAAL